MKIRWLLLFTLLLGCDNTPSYNPNKVMHDFLDAGSPDGATQSTEPNNSPDDDTDMMMWYFILAS